MIMIEYNGGHKAIKAATTYVNNLFVYTPFLEAIYCNTHFDMADVSPKKIVKMIEHTNLKLTLDLYLPALLSNKAYAYDDPNKQSIIHMNKIALNRPIHSICNTMVHQCVHALNAHHPSTYFGHGSNTAEGKDNTAPFWIAGLAQRIVAADDRLFEAMPHEDDAHIPLIQNNTSQQFQETLYHEGIFCVYDVMAILDEG